MKTKKNRACPVSGLNENELKILSAFLEARKSSPIEPLNLIARILAAWEKKPDAVDQGEIRFRQMFCSTCHSLAVVRGGETQLIGGDIGPELDESGKQSNDGLAYFLAAESPGLSAARPYAALWLVRRRPL